MIEFSRPITLYTDDGNLAFNADTGDRYLLIPEQCDAGADIRADYDDLPAADGAELHPGFASGYAVTFGLELLKDGHYAVGDERQQMYDNLQRALRAVRRSDGRLEWITSEEEHRILDNVRHFERLKATGGLLKSLTFMLRSRWPYAITSTEQDVALVDGDPTTCTNAGSATVYPVIVVDGPATDWTITNETTGETIEYDSGLTGAVTLGGGDTAEISCFRNTIYKNGDGANMLPGFVLPTSDFLTLVPGDNLVTLDGADGTIKFNNGWA